MKVKYVKYEYCILDYNIEIDIILVGFSLVNQLVVKVFNYGLQC